MRISKIEFRLEKTTPLEPLTGSESDRYANVKPAARCEIEIEKGDDLETAFKWARNTCFDQLVWFQEELVAAIKGA